MAGNRVTSALAPAGPISHAMPSNRSVEVSRRDTFFAAAALLIPLALAATCWAVTVWQLDGMNMGPATALGSFGRFAAVWMSMMAAMMLPGVAPAVLIRIRAGAPIGTAPQFVASYLTVWALVGGVLYLVYRPHGTIAAGMIVIGAGLYELAPLKRRCRMRCRETVRSGFRLGLACAGSSIGLMAMLAALGIMSVTWMSVLSAVVVVQKLLPPKAVFDVLVAAAIVAFGLWVLIAPGLLLAM